MLCDEIDSTNVYTVEIDWYIGPGFYWYIDIWPFLVDFTNWPQKVLAKRCYISHTSKQLAQESTTKQVKTVILQRTYWCFRKFSVLTMV